MKKVVFRVLLLLGVALEVAFFCMLFIVPNKVSVLSVSKPVTIGTWWWSKDLDETKYLDFAKRNGVTEVYYEDTDLNEDTARFIKKANSFGIKVYVLWGDKNWVADSAPLHSLIEKFAIYQNQNQDALFEGIHLDIEPHQFDDFNETSEKRKNYLTQYVCLVKEVCQVNIKIDFDIPAWYDDELELFGEKKKVYQYVMSYRDTASEAYSWALDEIVNAQIYNKKLMLCLEMDSDEGDKVSFKEEDKAYLYKEIEMLCKLGNYDFGIAIHNIETWQSLPHNRKK